MAISYGGTLGSNGINIVSGGCVGIGTAAPQTPLHIFAGESSGAAADGSYDVLTLENSTALYINLLTPTSASSGILFSDDTRAVGAIIYCHTGDERITMKVNGTADIFQLKNGTTTACVGANAAKVNIYSDATWSGIFNGTSTLTANEYLYFGSDQVYIGTAGAEAIRIDASQNVGIGTTVPDEILHVYTGSSGGTASSAADEAVFEGSGNSGITIQSGNTSVGGLHFGDDGDDDVGAVSYNHNTNSMRFLTCGAIRAAINCDGTFGIGTSDAKAKLEVAFDSGGFDTNNVASMLCTSSLAFEGNNDMRILFSQDGSTYRGMMGYAHAGAGYIGIWDNSSTSAPSLVSTGGEIGIGTDGPSQHLHVWGNATAPELLIEDAGNNTATITLDGARASENQETGKIFFAWNGNDIAKITGLAGPDTTNKDDGKLGFETAAPGGTVTRAMTIDESQNVGVGTTIPDALLHVHSGNSGQSANANADELHIESSSSEVGMTISGPANNTANVWFADPDSPNPAGISYNHQTDLMCFYTKNGTTGLYIDCDQGVCVTGALVKGSGSFKIDHPLEVKKDTHDLVHSFIEGPQADLIYRGVIELTDGCAQINVDTASGMTEGTFVALNRCVQAFTNNESNWDNVRGSVTGNTLTIESNDSASTASISWMVIGERCDKHIMEIDWTDDNGRVIVEPTKVT